MQRGLRHGILASAAVLALWGGLSARARAQEQAQVKRAPAYPRVNMVDSYEVDPAWPARPSHCQIGETPGVAVDREDQVWVYTRAVPPVQVYDASGRFIRAWGEDTVKKAHHIKFDSRGQVWLADIGHHVIRKYTPEGKLLSTLGTPDQPGEDRTHLSAPTDMAVTPAGEVFVSDGYGNNRVVHFDAQGHFVKSWGKLGTRPGEFSLPHAIALDSKGRLYVADRNNARVQVFDQGGQFLSEWRGLLVPWGFWMTASDEVWVCGSSPMPWAEGQGSLGCPPKDQLFMKLDTAGKVLQIWTVPKGEDGREKPGQCNWVHGMALDSKGNIYAGDIVGKRAQKFLRRS